MSTNTPTHPKTDSPTRKLTIVDQLADQIPSREEILADNPLAADIWQSIQRKAAQKLFLKALIECLETSGLFDSVSFGCRWNYDKTLGTDFWVYSKQTKKQAARLFCDFGGRLKKIDGDSWLELMIDHPVLEKFGVRFIFTIAKASVCKRVVTGSKLEKTLVTIPVEEVAEITPEELIDRIRKGSISVTKTDYKIVDIYGWQCDPAIKD